MEEQQNAGTPGDERGEDIPETTTSQGDVPLQSSLSTAFSLDDEGENPQGNFPPSSGGSSSPHHAGVLNEEESSTTTPSHSRSSSAARVEGEMEDDNALPMTDDNAATRRELRRQRQSTVSPRLLSLAAGTGVDEESYSTSLPYCQKAKALLAGLKRSDWLPPYDEDGVRRVTEECRALFRFVQELNPDVEELARVPELSCTLIVLHQCVLRNRRCLLAYASYRLEKIEALVWDLGMTSEISQEYASKLSRREMEHYHAYKSLVSEYQVACGVELLTNMQPPKDLFVEVRALKDLGEIVLESGHAVVLNKNTTHYVRRSDVELLIKQDSLVQID